MLHKSCISLRHLFSALLLLLFSGQSLAYSYAAAGKEPIIEGRELLLQALAKQDYSATQKAYDSMQAEFAYFNLHHDLKVDEQMQAAISAHDEKAILATLLTTMKAEVMRRVEVAEQNITDYQVAKVLVVKSKIFIDLLAADLTANNRQQADKAIRGVLTAIGNPGVFGVGQKPADKAKFIEYRNMLQDALAN